jgi:hypothetical protein
MGHNRTIGNRIWVGLLAFSLLVFAALDCVWIYLFAIRWMPRLSFVPVLLLFLYYTWQTYKALRRRISISN